LAFTTLSGGPIRQAALRIGPRAGIVLLAALLFWAAAYLVPVGMAQLALALVGATLALVAIWVVVIKRSIARSAQDLQARARELVGDDLAPSILTGPEGRIVYSNPAAVDAFDAGAAVTLA
jgi:two-component system cell cycle sensor histidine kinase/response regulator CckA